MSGCSRSGETKDLISSKIGEGLTLTYWLTRPEDRTSSTLSDIGSLRMYEYLEQETGVHIEFAYPRGTNALADLIARSESANLPDMIEWNWLTSYPGGPDQAISEGVIKGLGDMMRQHAPNLTRVLIEDQELARAVTSEAGDVYGFPYLKPEDVGRAVVGPVFRERWLEEIGQDVPRTIDEWHNVLWSFKDHDFGTLGSGSEYPFYMISFEPLLSESIVIPFLFESNLFAGAYDTSFSFYTWGDDIRYGPIDPDFELMLTTLAGWYAEGLINPSIGQTARSPGWRIIESLGKTGATVMDLANIPTLSPFGLVPAPPPSLALDTGMGSQLEPRYGGARTVAISASCDWPDEAMRWLDIGYGEAGHLAYNLGIPEETYSLKRGIPVLTDEVIADFTAKGGKGAFRDTMLFATSRGVTGGPYQLNDDLFALYAQTAFSSGSISSWGHRATDSLEYYLLHSPDLRTEFETIMAPIRQAVVVNFKGFISGQRPMEEFREFQAEISRMGIQRAHELLTQARNRFIAKRVVF
jgi:putative aldouronate transport system substrate-binding protein